ncbi:MAG: HEPN domain-containing protein [Anaerolineae bacterium]
MNNTDVEEVLNECERDLQRVKVIIDSLGIGSNIVLYLNSYAVVKACGTVEVAFKTILTDYCSRRSKKQVKEFLTKKVKDSSMNPSYDNIIRTLSEFDKEWKERFKDGINAHAQKDAIFTSIKSLVDARNSFAHGSSHNLTINDTIRYYSNFRLAIDLLDTIVS